MSVNCPRCGAVIREIDGVHSAGEPPVMSDARGTFIVCNKCSVRLDWPLRETGRASPQGLQNIKG